MRQAVAYSCNIPVGRFRCPSAKKSLYYLPRRRAVDRLPKVGILRVFASVRVRCIRTYLAVLKVGSRELPRHIRVSYSGAALLHAPDLHAGVHVCRMLDPVIPVVMQTTEFL